MGSMPKLEHAKLMFRAHKRECLNGASDLGIQHLSALSKVEVVILGNCMRDSNFDPIEDKNDGTVTWVATTINGAPSRHIRTVPVSDLKHGTIRSVNCSKV